MFGDPSIPHDPRYEREEQAMSDRELLELAAKAAGMKSVFEVWTPMTNPLTNDGDALRLAVKLNLQPRQGVNLVSVLRPDKGWNDENYRDHGGDPYAATRRAIVRAAAEIGRTM